MRELASPECTAAALTRVQALLHAWPRHAIPRALWLSLDPWTIENALITPTMKLKRQVLEKRFADRIEALYAGHEVPA